MQTTLLVHVAGGGLGILAGFVALFAAEGAPLHRRAGMVFVCAMLTMGAAGRLRGAPRLARHLWRMSFALFIAALSFFLGRADVFPQAARIPVLLASPVLLVLLTMLYWLWRVRVPPPPRAGVALGGLPAAEVVTEGARLTVLHDASASTGPLR